MNKKNASQVFQTSALLFLGVLAGCSTASKKPQPTAPGQKPEPVPVGVFEKIRIIGDSVAYRKVYPNGLKLVVVERTQSPTFAYQTWFNVGSRHEVRGKTGLAHLFEHMMFKGTRNIREGDRDRIVEQAGAEGHNAFTSQDYTAYVQELPKESLELVAKLESDRMVNLLVNEKSFRTEVQVVQNERKLREENSPDGTLYIKLFETAFREHPYHWPVIGYKADLEGMTAADAEDFYKKFYSPSRATVVVVGDLSPSQVDRMVQKYYGTLKPVPLDNPPAVLEPEQTARRKLRVPLKIQVDKLLMGFRVPGVLSEDAPVFEVIQAVLSDGKSSRLRRALVDSGIAISADSGSFMNTDPSVFVVGVDLQKGKSAVDAEEVVMRELQRLANSPVPDQELVRAKSLLKFGKLSHLAEDDQLANFIGQAEVQFGHVLEGIQFFDRVLEVDAAQIQRVAAKYFRSQNMTVIQGVPQK